MCGIFGHIGSSLPSVKAATDVIQHRGPDAEGFLSYDTLTSEISRLPDAYSCRQSRLVQFGFRRLSIIDLSHEADQPFSLNGDKLHLIFNGEIYNYLELRLELQTLGYIFRTESDSEVLLNAYAEWGEACLPRFNGMWSFAILDLRKNKIFCARDRFGVKPFYYHSNGGHFTFASEIKQLFKAEVPKQINERVIRDFLDKSINDHTEETFFANVFQLKPGHWLNIDLGNPVLKPEIKPYWKLQAKESYGLLSYEEACMQFRELLQQSIMLRFRSDVPVGSCLSGGLDSSSIVCLAAETMHRPMHSFTCRFDSKDFDESFYANLVNDKYPIVTSNYCSLNEDTLVNEIDKLIFHQDEPFGSFGIMAQWEVMKLARSKNITVLLDGQGGDELLGGYRKYYAFYLKELMENMQWTSFVKESYHLIKNKEFKFFNTEGIKRYLGLTQNANYLSEYAKQLPYIKSIGLSSVKNMNEKSKEDIEQLSFPPLLRYEDRNSMAHSIEARVPFMDYRLVEFAFSLPASFKIKNGYTKSLLRDSMKGVLPDQTRLRISKLGFATPQSEWMERKLNRYFKDYFTSMNNPYLNSKLISEKFSKYPNCNLHSWDFSRFYIFDKWFQANFS
jgi:asparagine synthase (glutamine-hydrolysing)